MIIIPRAFQTLYLTAFIYHRFHMCIKRRLIGMRLVPCLLCHGCHRLYRSYTHTVVPARGVPLTQMPRCSIHTARAIRSEGPDMMDHLEWKEAAQTGLFSQLWYAKHTIATPAKGPISVARCLVVHMARTERRPVQLLCTGCGPM